MVQSVATDGKCDFCMVLFSAARFYLFSRSLLTFRGELAGYGWLVVNIVGIVTDMR